MALPAEPSAAPADAAHFSVERFDANLRALVALGARTDGSEALASARRWAEANVPATQATARVVLSAPVATSELDGDALVQESSGAAFVVEVARAAAARGEAVGVALEAGPISPTSPIANAELVVYVRRACGLPLRRDLLSHRVLRERFFRIATAPAAGFEHTPAPHVALLAAGAKRVVALDAFAGSGDACHPGAFGDALLRFVSDATALLARGRSNSSAPTASQGPSKAPSAP